MGIRDTNAYALRDAAKTPAERLVADIIYNLDDRRGIGHEYRAIDDEVRAEMVASWEAIAETHVGVVRAERAWWIAVGMLKANKYSHAILRVECVRHGEVAVVVLRERWVESATWSPILGETEVP